MIVGAVADLQCGPELLNYILAPLRMVPMISPLNPKLKLHEIIIDSHTVLYFHLFVYIAIYSMYSPYSLHRFPMYSQFSTYSQPKIKPPWNHQPLVFSLRLGAFLLDALWRVPWNPGMCVPASGALWRCCLWTCREHGDSSITRKHPVSPTPFLSWEDQQRH